MNPAPTLILVDNGSIRAESTRNLRTVAQALGERLGRTVHPVSIGFSDRIDPEALEGRAADTLVPFLEKRYTQGERAFFLIPFFFSSGGGIVSMMEQKLKSLKSAHPDLCVRIGAFIFEESQSDNLGVARILASRVRETLQHAQLKKPSLILVDHGSPKVQAAYVRNLICGQLSALLEGEVGAVGAASMERREGEHYAFNEPLLEKRLQMEGFDRGDVVLAMLFLSPGRHAGEGGDIAEICEEAMQENPALRIHRTELVGTHPDVVSLLENAFRRSE